MAHTTVKVVALIECFTTKNLPPQPTKPAILILQNASSNGVSKMSGFIETDLYNPILMLLHTKSLLLKCHPFKQWLHDGYSYYLPHYTSAGYYDYGIIMNAIILHNATCSNW